MLLSQHVGPAEVYRTELAAHSSDGGEFATAFEALVLFRAISIELLHQLFDILLIPFLRLCLLGSPAPLLLLSGGRVLLGRLFNLLLLVPIALMASLQLLLLFLVSIVHFELAECSQIVLHFLVVVLFFVVSLSFLPHFLFPLLQLLHLLDLLLHLELLELSVVLGHLVVGHLLPNLYVLLVRSSLVGQA